MDQAITSAAVAQVVAALRARRETLGADRVLDEVIRRVGSLLRRRASGPEMARLLVGCGPGLTPAGDDFLMGFMFGLEYLSDRGGRRYRALCRAVRPLLERTSSAGARFLADACEGRYPEEVRNVGALAGTAVSTLLAVGATSGFFALLGVLAAVDRGAALEVLE